MQIEAALHFLRMVVRKPAQAGVAGNVAMGPRCRQTFSVAPDHPKHRPDESGHATHLGRQAEQLPTIENVLFGNVAFKRLRNSFKDVLGNVK